MLDAGHGGIDSGAIYGNYKEKDFTLTLTLQLGKYLYDNFKVSLLYTRQSDKTVSLDERVTMANIGNIDYFLSMHINAGGGKGFESYIYSGNIPDSTIKKQNIIHQSIIRSIGPLGAVDRGTKRADFMVLRQTSMDAILLENLFIDTQSDLDKLNDFSFTGELIKGIGDGLGSALNLPSN
jgi:N-acetylmuramoyl-L-alanine amidase